MLQLMNELYKRNFHFIYLTLYTFYKSIKERHEIRLLKGLIKKGDVVIDAGANVGFYTLKFSELVGETGMVYAFEPDPFNFSVLQKRCQKKLNIKVVQAALSDSTGEIDFFLSEDLNVDHVAYDNGEKRKKITVKSFALDDYLKGNGIDKVNFIKTDLQGYDPVAIRGMRKTLQNLQSFYLYSEFWPWGLKNAGIEASSWLEEMKSYGLYTKDEFELRIDPKYYTSLLFMKN